MPKHSYVDPEFTRHICAEIDAYISQHGLTDVEAARILGVRKQMIKPYRQGRAMPGTQVIARACIHWNLRFSYQGFEISASSFVPSNGRPQAIPNQLHLPFGESMEFRGISPRVRDVQMTVSLRLVS
jgi:transcriptional regulator with XRE-family HTH domain